MSSIGKKIPSRRLRCRGVLAPMSCYAFWRTTTDFDDKSTTMTIELKRERSIPRAEARLKCGKEPANPFALSAGTTTALIAASISLLSPLVVSDTIAPNRPNVDVAFQRMSASGR